LRKTYEPHVYEGAAHGFLRAQGGNNGANMRASQEAWNPELGHRTQNQEPERPPAVHDRLPAR